MFCMFIRLYDVTYVKIQFNHWKLRDFISSSKMIKNTIKLYRRFLLDKTNKKIRRKPEVKWFLHSQVWRHLTEFKIF